MLKDAVPSVSVSSVQSPTIASLSSNAVSESRYSTFSRPLPLSDAVTVTVWVFLKNRPKVIVFIKELNLFVLIVISAAGGVISATPKTVMTISLVTGDIV